MQLLSHILGDIAVVLLTIVVLAMGLYVVLLILEWGLKLKSGSRESEGLAHLWQSSVSKSPPPIDGKPEAVEQKKG